MIPAAVYPYDNMSVDCNTNIDMNTKVLTRIVNIDTDIDIDTVAICV